MDMRKNFSEYWQFGQALLKRFVSPGITIKVNLCNFFMHLFTFHHHQSAAKFIFTLLRLHLRLVTAITVSWSSLFTSLQHTYCFTNNTRFVVFFLEHLMHSPLWTRNGASMKKKLRGGYGRGHSLAARSANDDRCINNATSRSVVSVCRIPLYSYETDKQVVLKQFQQCDVRARQ
jgi:hypothetical protein